MIPASFEYAVPATLSEAFGLLTKHPDAKILAGGHSLIPMMKFRVAQPALLIDINKVPDLAYIKEDAKWLKIGALTREADLDNTPLIRDKYPLLADATKVIADPLVRNMATVGGNLAHADPANDHPAVMLAYDAVVIVTGTKGSREVPITKFFTGPFTPDIAHGEILTEIRIPLRKAGDGGCYLKIERKVGDYATAAVGVFVRLGAKGVCEYAGIGLTNLGLMPIKATAACKALMGGPLSDAKIREAAQLASEAAEPTSDWRGTEEYKRALVKTLTVRALRQAVKRAAA